ncbi:hypothetical protein AB0P15_37380 [Streptomyces sp. NPDC087917]|uniref:hypothetical protein n=1 Tax=unclassified Streptomyces TaxID=2593676 RepID=UPI0034150972
MPADPAGGLAALRGRLAPPDSRVRDALNRPIDLNLVFSRESSAGMMAISPEVGLELIPRRQEAGLARRQPQPAARITGE